MKFHIDEIHLTDHLKEQIHQTIKRVGGAHMTDIDIRINGTNERREGDWIKHLQIGNSWHLMHKVPHDRPVLLAIWGEGTERWHYVVRQVPEDDEVTVLNWDPPIMWSDIEPPNRREGDA
tara:strand:+ start:1228 stop:1587 length:360 start_codon:yes stop_codon:yes gene_type:complete